MASRLLRVGALLALAVPPAGLLSVSAAPKGPAKPVGVNAPVRQAIGRGVVFLKRSVGATPNYKGGAHGVGTASLVGLALLESGVKPEDPVLRSIASFVRREALEDYRTYNVSLVLMFLDRLGQKSDEPLLQYMAVRLLAGQGSDGTWTYDCSDGKRLDEHELKRLRGALVREVRLVARPNARPGELPGKAEPAVPRDDLPVDRPDGKPEAKKGSGEPVAEPPALDPEAEKYLKLANVQNGPKSAEVDGDHSNTQFGTIGLWCARKHGVPVTKALTTLEKHYRQCQNEDGGWGYVGRGSSSQSMTCAGLLGLATGFGARQAVQPMKQGEQPPGPAADKPVADPGKDEAIKRGLTQLGKVLTASVANLPVEKLPRRNILGRFGGGALGDDLYFIWSLERVGVIYGLETIGDVDWYAEGAKALIARQHPDGSWNDEVDTSFALLFLNRANFTRDLTRSIQGRVRDPGRHEFRSADPRDLEKLFGKSADPRLRTGDPERQEKAPGPEPEAVPKVTPAAPAPADAKAFNAEADRLANALVAATPDERATLIAKLRDAKGAVYTEALLRALPRLEGDGLRETREALAVRLTRMRAETLREMLRDEDRELRRAAALACAMKEDRSHVPDLIKAIEDKESLVTRAARAALKTLTGQDFGPEADADKAKAAEAWRAWWNKSKGG